MKTIGRTDQGNAIVEMTDEEYIEFLRLENIIVNKRFYFDAPQRNFRGADMSPVFKALSELANAKQSIRTIQEYINTLADYFGKVELPEEKEIDA